jgi:perosamine synthetase
MIPRHSPTYTSRQLCESLRYEDSCDIKAHLEGMLRDYYNCKYAALVGSARLGLYYLIKALRIEGEILVPAYTCIVVPEAITLAGGRPRFVDIEYASLNLSQSKIAAALTPSTRAVLVTHTFGISSDVQETASNLRSKGVLVIEDAAAALGARYQGQLVGTCGDAAIVSFESTKVLSGGGGGAIITNNDEIGAALSRMASEREPLRESFGFFCKCILEKLAFSRGLYPMVLEIHRRIRGDDIYEVVIPDHHITPGYLRGMAAGAMNLVALQFPTIEDNLRKRREIAHLYTNTLPELPSFKKPVVPLAAAPAWIQYPVRVSDKYGLLRHMQRNGIDMSWNYKYSVAESYCQKGFVNAKRAAETVLGLPTYPSLSYGEAEMIVQTINMFYRSRKR